MSETLSFEATNTEQANASHFQPESQHPSYIDPEIDDSELYNLVSQNAHVVVKLGGSVMTLSEAMSQIPITKDNIPSVVSFVYELLTNAALETEEPVDEADSDEEETTETDDVDEKPEAKSKEQKAEPETKNENKQVQPKPEAKLPQQPEPLLEKIASSPKPEYDEVIEPKTEANIRNTSAEPKLNAYPEVVPVATTTPETTAEVANTSSNSMPEQITSEILLEPQTSTSNIGSTVNESAPKPELASQAELTHTAESSEHDTSISRVEVAELIPENSQSAEDKEQPDLSVVSDIRLEVEPTELLSLDSDSSDQLEDLAIEQEGQDPEIIEYETVLVTPDFEAVDDGLSYFSEGGIVLEQFEESGLKPNEQSEADELDLEIQQLKLDIEPIVLAPVKTLDYEQPAEANLPAEQIEETLIELAEVIETSPPETAEVLNEILDKIVALPARLENGDNQNIAEGTIPKELAELFVELLEIAGIEYTPELIESLVQLTLEWDLGNGIEKLADKENSDDTAQDIGTHEFIKALLIGLNFMQKAMVQAGVIGKLALQP